MSTKVYLQGSSGEVAVPANEKIAVFSNSEYQVFQLVGYPNLPPTWNLIKSGAAGETYTSDAFSVAATVRVDAGPSDAFYEVGTAPVVAEPMADQEFADATGVISGLAAAQGGASTIKGGTSSTAGNAGGAAALLGGQPGATGAGGAATVTGGAGGATSGTGGAASVTGGAGTNGDAVGGASSIVGGTGQGTAAGGATAVTGGASGAGATGDGGDVAITGGAAASTDGSGGGVVLKGGAKAGSGLDGGVFNRGTFQFRVMPTPATATNTASLTDAQMVAGVLVATPTAAAAYTVRTGTQLKAALPADMIADDSFDLVIINLGGTGDDITLTADTDITIVGDPVVGPIADVATEQMSSGTFRFRFVTGTTFVAYRVA
jgi:hypothetical protein